MYASPFCLHSLQAGISLLHGSVCLISSPSSSISEARELGWRRGGASSLQLCRLEQSRRWHFKMWPSLPAVWSTEARLRRSCSHFSCCLGYGGWCCHQQQPGCFCSHEQTGRPEPPAFGLVGGVLDYIAWILRTGSTFYSVSALLFFIVDFNIFIIQMRTTDQRKHSGWKKCSLKGFSHQPWITSSFFQFLICLFSFSFEYDRSIIFKKKMF